MKKTYVTADLHFGHANIMKFNPATRQYTDVTHMNESMVAEWNKTVNPDDLVYILGDIAFCSAAKAVAYLHRLNGRKVLIEGNHDHKLVQDKAFRDCFESIHTYLELNYSGQMICMFHYRIAEWNRGHHGSMHLYGHQHGSGGETGNRSMDVGMDATGNIVSNLDDIVAQLKKFENIGHH